MDHLEGVEELQRVADYRKARNRLRAFGVGTLIFGGLAVFLGVMLLSEHVVNFALILIGGFLIVAGLVNVLVPTPAGVIVDGIALIIVGVWNLFITVINLGADVVSTHWGFIGLMQIGYGIYRFVSYGQFAKELSHQPPPEDVKRLDELVKDLQRSKMKENPDVITFKTANFMGGWKEWRGRLGGAALFVHPQGHEVLIAHPDDVEFTRTGKVLLGSTLKARFKIREQTLNGQISPESFARYEDWKFGPADENDAGDNEA